MLDKIETVLNKKIRPSLAVHNGDVRIVSYENQILKIQLLGQCSGCPSALLTTEELIGKELKNTFPEIEDVILVTGVSDSLLNMAKQILVGGNVPC